MSEYLLKKSTLEWNNAFGTEVALKSGSKTKRLVAYQGEGGLKLF